MTINNKARINTSLSSFVYTGEAEMTAVFEMTETHYQIAEVRDMRQMALSSWSLSIFFSFLFFSVEAMKPWTIEHRVFRYDCFVKNDESITVVIDSSSLSLSLQSQIEKDNESVFSLINCSIKISTECYLSLISINYNNRSYGHKMCVQCIEIVLLPHYYHFLNSRTLQ